MTTLDTTASAPAYEIYALRYATMTGRSAHQNMIAPDPHEAGTDLDYFIWLVRGGGRLILVDTGFGEAAARERGRTLTIHPVDALAGLGVTPEAIDDVIITHLHYDHAGNLDRFARARFHIQEREMAFATGRCMCHPVLRHPFSVEDVTLMVRHVYGDRVTFHAGDGEIAAGVSVHHVGGHSDGLQIVRVNTQRGPVVLASDAAHFFANIEQGKPFPIVFNVGDMALGWARALRLAGAPERLIPGHDPRVRSLYRRLPGPIDIHALHEKPLAQV